MFMGWVVGALTVCVGLVESERIECFTFRWVELGWVWHRTPVESLP